MKCTNVSGATLQRAAALVGCRIETHQLAQNGRSWRIKLRADSHDSALPRTARDERGRYVRYGFQRRADGKRRRSGALCWHGFRDFFRAVFVAEPFARIRTAHAFYKGAAEFEALFQRTGETNVGSVADPVCYADLCACESDNGFENASAPFLAPGFGGPLPAQRKGARRAFVPHNVGAHACAENGCASAPDGEST